MGSSVRFLPSIVGFRNLLLDGQVFTFNQNQFPGRSFSQKRHDEIAMTKMTNEFVLLSRLKKNQTWNRQYTTRAALYIPAGKESSAFLAETALLANWQSYS
jgi:hypothetical protein